MKHTHKILMSVAMAALVLVSLGAISAVSAVQGSSANVQAPPLVGAGVQGAPAVCSQDGTSLDLFVRDINNQLWWLHSADGTKWDTSKAVPLGGICTSNPAATSPAAGYIDVFVRGDTGVLWEMIITNAGAMTPTTTWKQVGGAGQLLAGTGPAAYSFGGVGQPGSQVGWFVTGTTHNLYQMWNDSTGTHGWQNLGGYLTSGPAATALSDGTAIGVIVGGTDGVIWYQQGTPSGWQGWTRIGGQLLSGTSPTAYNWGTSRIGWFVTGTNSQLYHMWSGKTNGWENLDGVLTSSPGATSKAVNTIDVFAKGSGGGMGALWQMDYTSGWNDWTFVGQVG